jgi:D-alanyl-lipoteichoic acid acyltransferase DltB (MBOAT superfamily)
MHFNSYTFIVFFVIVLALYYQSFSWNNRKIILLIASYLFYAAWNPPFVILLWISTLVDWFISKRIYKKKNRENRKWLLSISLIVNLGLLVYFKYSGFLLESFENLLAVFNIQFHAAIPDIILPVGISFYTFQTLSYTLDIYKGKAKPWDTFLDYALYVTFFPQLVAGPIVRSSEFLPQCKIPKKFNADQLGWGAALMGLGMFQKIIIADSFLAPIVEQIYDNQMVPDTISAWAGTLAFSGQIFNDFAGYSTCAIGVALCLGFKLPENFNYPYAALNLSEFWKRWHISLSTWMRDYLFLPVAYSIIRSKIIPKKLKDKPEVWGYLSGIFITMFIGGLWHGAGWTFVLWGILHGIYLIIGQITRKNRKKIKKILKLSKYEGINIIIKIITTFTLVSFAWVFFRSHSFQQALTILAAMFGLVSDRNVELFNLSRTDIITSFFIVFIILCIHWLMRNRQLKDIVENMHWMVHSFILSVMLISIIFLSGENNAFIYFQF